MKKIQIIILILIAILLIVSIIIGVILMNTKKEEEKSINEVTYIEEIEPEVGIYPLDNYNYYFSILSLIKNYYQYIDEQEGNGVYSLLDEEYKTENGINIDNVLNKVQKPYEGDCSFNIKEIYNQDNGTDIIYYVFGKLKENSSNNFQNIYVVVTLDKINGTFSICPIEKNKYDNYVQNGITAKKERIKNNDYNKFQMIIVKEQTIVENLFNNFKLDMLGNPEDAYNSLDKEYREARFGSLNNFKQYVEKNREEITKISASEYVVNTYSGYTEYVIKDQYGNFYIFDEKSISDYTVKLDTYTLEQEKFNTEYEKATNKQKVLMNLDKFFQMLNTNDYKSAYAVLDDNYKAKYFPTEETFEAVVKQYMYPHAKATYMNFSDEVSGVFTYYVELTNKANTNDKTIGINVVMQLREGTDFRLSFTIVQ